MSKQLVQNSAHAPQVNTAYIVKCKHNTDGRRQTLQWVSRWSNQTLAAQCQNTCQIVLVFWPSPSTIVVYQTQCQKTAGQPKHKLNTSANRRKHFDPTIEVDFEPSETSQLPTMVIRWSGTAELCSSSHRQGRRWKPLATALRAGAWEALGRNRASPGVDSLDSDYIAIHVMDYIIFQS